MILRFASYGSGCGLSEIQTESLDFEHNDIAVRLELLEAEKQLTRRSDELALTSH